MKGVIDGKVHVRGDVVTADFIGKERQEWEFATVLCMSVLKSTWLLQKKSEFQKFECSARIQSWHI